jgi:hypothetical protein
VLPAILKAYRSPSMGFYTDQFLPRFTDLALGKPMEATRARVVAGLSGEVLELGFGSFGRAAPCISWNTAGRPSRR